MLTNAQARSLLTAQTVADHNQRMGWDIADDAHALHMMIADLMVFASTHGLDFDAEVTTAREVVAEVYEEADLTRIEGAAVPAYRAPRIAVAVEGGIVQSAVSDRPGVFVTVIDYDNDEVEVPQSDGTTSSASVHDEAAAHDPAWLDALEAAL